MSRILVIDSFKRENFWRALGRDCDILFAESLEKGKSLLSDGVELIFLNMNVTGMNGAEALGTIRERCPLAAVVLIASGDFEERAETTASENAGIASTKAEEMLGKIKALLDGNEVSRCSSRALEELERYPEVPSRIAEGVLKVRDYLSLNSSEQLPLPAACRMAGISKTYFCRYFKLITGHSFKDYHNLIRIGIAGELLKDRRLSVADVALKLGYKDANYFSTIYKKHTGISPGQRKTAR